MDFITTKEAATLLKKSEWSMVMLRKAKSGPPYYRIGKAVLYDRQELTQWIQSCRVAG